MPSIDRQILAEQYGFALSMMNSNPELKKLFDRAVKETWTPDRFTAGVRNTKWFKSTSETRRNAQVLYNTDRKTFDTNVGQVATRIRLMATELGARLSDSTKASLAHQAYVNGWDDNQLRFRLTDYIKFTDGRFLGQAGQWEQDLKKYADDMGVGLSQKSIRSWVESAARGTITIDDAMTRIRETAQSKYPHLAKRLEAGETVDQIADPYRQTAAQLLEMNPSEFRLTGSNSTVAKALQYQDPKTGEPRLRTLYDFENDVRQDSRWKRTNNAKQAAASTVNGLLQSMGLIS